MAYHPSNSDNHHFVISQMAYALPGIWRWLVQPLCGIMGSEQINASQQ
jgi:hypothetical protein